MNPPTTIAPFPTASGAIGCNTTVYEGSTHDDAPVMLVYAGEIAFSIQDVDTHLDGLMVEEPINYEVALDTLRQARQIEERDFPVGGPFGA